MLAAGSVMLPTMSDLETLLRRLIREEIRSALEEVLPRLQEQHAAKRPEPEDRLLLSAREAAKRLAISDRSLFTLTKSGQLPCVRVGTSKRYSVETLRRWIQQSEADPTPGSVVPQVQKSISSPPAITPMRPRNVKLGRAGKTTKKKSQSPLKAEKPVSRNAAARQIIEEEERASPNPFSLLLAEIGVDRADLPPLTNGDLRRIAEVDIPTFHGWQYLNRPMAEEAIEKMRKHFRQYKKET
jgi:excisionase family DNA binding protein